MNQNRISYFMTRTKIQGHVARQHQRAHSLSKSYFIQSIFDRRGPVESHLSIAPREGIDFFAKRDEDLLLFPLKIRIDNAVEVARETRKHVLDLESTVERLSLALSIAADSTLLPHSLMSLFQIPFLSLEWLPFVVLSQVHSVAMSPPP
jgi:hypothetical protein